MNHDQPLPRLAAALSLLLLLTGCPAPQEGEGAAGPKPTGEYDLPAPPAPAPSPAPAQATPPEPAPASAPAVTAAPPAAAPAAGGGALYQVVDGYKVDANTLAGFRAWRSAACDRCHGANQEGLVGPSLLEGMKVLSRAEFDATVLKGRLDKGMPSFGENPAVTTQLDALYAYLKGRSDGAITRAKVEAM